jgi:DNA modification methylase
MDSKILVGDCRERLKEIPDNSIDSIVTDPPYELGFMGKGWDASGIAYDPKVWAECLRVLKPGGHLLAFSGSRTYHRMTCAIEDAGFEVRDQIMWVYGSGFPKSLNVSKAIDKGDRIGIGRSRAYKFTTWMRGTGMTAGKINQILREAGVISEKGTMGGHFVDVSSGQPAIATAELFDKLRPHLPPVPPEIEELVAWRTVESENFKKREKIGERETSDPAGYYSSGFEARETRTLDITKAHTPEAIRWQGWGTALKPAHEPICVARKPLIGTVAENVLEHGTGAINVDGCRVGTNYEREPKDEVGRWPANFIHDGSPEVTALFPSVKTGGAGKQKDGEGSYFGGGVHTAANHYGDTGSAARFFYCAKASKKDRDEGLDGFEKKKGAYHDYRENCETTHGLDSPRAGAGRTSPRANNHPTVKPTDLMRYLCRLVTPPGGLVLDPFTGSGSTGKAAMLEGFRFLGCELSPEYAAIAEARIKGATKENEPAPKKEEPKKENKPALELDLFGHAFGS